MKRFDKIVKSFNKTIDKLMKTGAELSVEVKEAQDKIEFLEAEQAAKEAELTKCYSVAGKLKQIIE